MRSTVSPDLTTKPYFIAALWNWCQDYGFTPYLAVQVDEQTIVPAEVVQKDGQVTLNISDEAVSMLDLGNEYISFKARFNGVACDVSIPMKAVNAIYARENGIGMNFPISEAGGSSTVKNVEPEKTGNKPSSELPLESHSPKQSLGKKTSHLRRIK